MVYARWEENGIRRSRRDLEVAKAIETIVDYVDDADEIKNVIRGICEYLADVVEEKRKAIDEYNKQAEIKEAEE